MRVGAIATVSLGQARYGPRSELEVVARVDGAPRATLEVVWRAEALGTATVRAPEEYVVHSAVIDGGSESIVRCRLPRTPLSYKGRLFQVSWWVRVRVDGEAEVNEFPFVVG